MRAGADLVVAIAENFNVILDPRVGIVGTLEELERPPGAPDFIHYRARACDTGSFAGERNERTADAAGTDREAAAAEATAAAVARYCAALYERDGLPLATLEDAQFTCVKPAEFALYSHAQYRLPGFPWVEPTPDLPIRWAAVTDFVTGGTVYVPAAFVRFPYRFPRDGGDLPIGQPSPAGLACRAGVAAATLAGLAEVAERDALAIFWQAMVRPPQVILTTLPKDLLGLIRRFEAPGDRVVILDVATDNRLPTFVAALLSERRERPAHVFAAATGLDPAATIAAALGKLAARARLAQEVWLKMPPVSSTNDWEDVVEAVDHLCFAADHANRGFFAFAFSSDDRRAFASYENEATGVAEDDLALYLGRIGATGHKICAANLTTEDVALLGLAVCRAIVPGYQPLHAGHRLRALGGARLYEVPQKLGYRGIARGQAGNPAPHPFY